MSKIDEILDSISAADVAATIDEVLVIDPNTRQINIPSAELTFGVESDTHSERKYFLCPRVVGDNLDLTSCFIRVNFRNANGDMDAYLVDDVIVVDDNIMFSWLLSRKVTDYAGQVRFVVCASRPGRTGADVVEWHTTQTNGVSLAGLEPDASKVEAETSDVVAQLIALVESQGESVLETGETVRNTVIAAAEAEKATVLGEIEAKGTNTLASIPDDYTALGEAVEGLTRNTAGAIVCKVEGESAYVSDASDNYVQSLRVFGRSTQDGVPSPDAPVEIESVENPTVSVFGKNLCNMKAFGSMGMNGTANTYDSTTHTITMTADSTTSSGRYGSPVSMLPVGEKCTVSFDIRGTSGKKVNCGWDKAKTGITLSDGFVRYSSTMTITNKREALSFYTVHVNLGGLAVGEYMQFANVQIEVGDVATEYEEYRTSQTLPITHTLHGIPVSSGGNYTDSNGQQWICDEVDLERGVYVQRVSNIILEAAHGMTYNETAGALYYSINPVGIYGKPIYSTHFPNMNFNGSGTALVFLGFGSSDEFKRYVTENEVGVLYPLANPIETPLTETEIAAYRALHTNKPNTTVLNDAGAWMNVEYVADTKFYIDNKIAALVSGT